jgi:hypothetical protein
LEILLYQVAQDIKKRVDDSRDSICLIFVYDDYRGAYTLRASTSPGVSLGAVEFAPTHQEKDVVTYISEQYSLLSAHNKECLRNRCNINGAKELFSRLTDTSHFKEVAAAIDLVPITNFGFTKFCLYTEQSFFVANASAHPILSNDKSAHDLSYSLTPKRKLSSLLCSFTKLDNIKMIIRLESSERNKTYTDTNITTVYDVLREYRIKIKSCLFLSNLVSIGYRIDLRELCTSAAQTLASLLDAKGCSIFLLDQAASSDCLLPYSPEDYSNDPGSQEEARCNKCDFKGTATCNDRRLVYRCYGTTGLCVISKAVGVGEVHRDPVPNPYDDPRATYDLRPSKCRKDQKPAISLTEGVIWSRQNAYVDVHEEDSSSDFHLSRQFTQSFKLARATGEGKCSEDLWEKRKGKDYERSQCILYAPLCFRERSSQYIPALGAIRVLKPVVAQGARRPVEEKNYFVPEEIHLFFSFVEQLSKAILHAKYIAFLDEFSNIRSTKELYMFAVKEVPKYVGATDCGIYIKKGQLLTMKAEWNRGNENYYEDDDEASTYNLGDENDIGYTLWVAQHRKPLLFNSHDDLERISVNLPEGSRPRHRPKDTPEPERFLGIPIFQDGADGPELLGVFRICKSSRETLFTADDQQISSQICNRLSKELQKSRAAEKRREELERQFSRKLLDVLWEVPHLGDAALKLRSSLEANGADIATTVLGLMEADARRYLPNQRLEVFKDFERFNSEILRRLPYYRDHFIHQYVVYLLGGYIIRKILALRRGSEEIVFRNSYSRGDEQSELDGAIHSLWFIVSNYHDISYPFAMTSDWYQRVFARFLPVPTARKIGFQSEILKYIFLNKDQLHLSRIDEIVAFHKKIGRADEDLRSLIMNELIDEERGMDHAVLSALVVMNEQLEGQVREVCASAILLHNRLFMQAGVEKIRFDEHPLAFLLIYCDFLHEWGREQSPADERGMFHRLEEIVVSARKEDVVEAGFPKEMMEGVNRSGAVYIYVSIQVKDEAVFRKKLEEARKICTRLQSGASFVFCFKINHEPYVI